MVENNRDSQLLPVLQGADAYINGTQSADANVDAEVSSAASTEPMRIQNLCGLFADVNTRTISITDGKKQAYIVFLIQSLQYE